MPGILPQFLRGTKAECQHARAKAECHQNKAECRFLTALLLARQWCNKKPGPGLFLLLLLLLGLSRARCLNRSR